jgi:hypothetical protein
MGMKTKPVEKKPRAEIFSLNGVVRSEIKTNAISEKAIPVLNFVNTREEAKSPRHIESSSVTRVCFFEFKLIVKRQTNIKLENHALSSL